MNAISSRVVRCHKAQQKAALREAKKLLIECGEYKNAETAKLWEDAAKKGKRS
jgi:hypothetical protein